MTKRVLSVLLAVVLVAAMACVATMSVSAKIEVEGASGDTYRYYFLCPDNWLEEGNTNVGFYFWDPAEYAKWPGATMKKLDTAATGLNIFYEDFPVETTTIIFNNYRLDTETRTKHQTENINVEEVVAGDVDDPASEYFPNGLPSYDGMIFIIDPEKISENPFSGETQCGGRWYYFSEKLLKWDVNPIPDETTEEPTIEETTVAPDTTVAETTKPDEKPVPTGDSALMAIAAMTILVAAAGAIIFARKKVEE